MFLFETGKIQYEHIKQLVDGRTERQENLMNSIAMQMPKQLRQQIFDITVKLAEKVACKTVHQFSTLIEFCSAYTQSKAEENTESRPERKAARKKFIGQLVNDSKSFQELNDYYSEMFKAISIANEKYLYRFENVYSALYHYEKHKVINNKELTIDEYYQLAQIVFELGDASLGKNDTIYRYDQYNRLKGVLKKNNGTWYMATFFEDSSFLKERVRN